MKDKTDKKKEPQEPYPKSIFFIIGNEFCERFSYYGMRTVLVVYLTQVLWYSDNAATMIFHIFAMACYFTPILGAIIADSWLGKFKTIFYISIIYAAGNLLIAGGSIPHSLKYMNTLSLIGLALIAIGTGGIKPCVSAFGGDQFRPGQEKHLAQFFSFFYLAINLGSAFSTFITPVLRTDVTCFDQDTCFPLAFGVPAILMLTSLVIFLIGKPLYRITPPQGNVMTKFCGCIFHAISRKCSAKEKKKAHWLDYADDKYDKSFIKATKTVLHVLLLYILLPVFWALFDQQGSKWTLQAVRMDGRIIGGYTIKPDQMQTWNPVFVIICIPLFEYVVYPLFDKCKILRKPLQRITVGGLLAASSFVLAGVLQIAVENSMPAPIPHGLSEAMIVNDSPCQINVRGDHINRNISAFGETWMYDFKQHESQTWNITSEDCSGLATLEHDFKAQYPFQAVMITTTDTGFAVFTKKMRKEKVESSNANLTMFYNIQNLNMNGSTLSGHPLWMEGEGYSSVYFAPSLNNLNGIGTTELGQVDPVKYKVCFRLERNVREKKLCAGEVYTDPGAVYVISVYMDPKNISDVEVKKHIIVEPNNVHLLYQAPQYLLITIGEIMFSITGLEFSYSQAPKTMKSVLQAAWLLTVAFGNVIVVLVAKFDYFSKQSNEFFMYAGLMGADMLLFATVAMFYKYVDPNEEEVPGDEEEQSKDETKSEKENGSSNQAYQEDTKF